MPKNDALPLEYKLNDLCAGRQVDACDFANDSLLQSERRVLGLSFQEELINLGRRQLSALANNRTDL